MSEALSRKADVEDLSRMVSEVIKATAIDFKPDIEDLKRKLSGKISKQELVGTLKAQNLVMEELRKE